jgi:AbrB family looped-hinge helix DNA binding protein
MTTERTLEYARRTLPHLVQAARAGRTITYGELARRCGFHWCVSAPVLGHIRDDLCLAQGFPLLTAIVVREATGLPGESFLPAAAPHLAGPELRRAFERHRDAVFGYGHWDELLALAGVRPAADGEEPEMVAVTPANQVVIPAVVCQRLGVRAGDRLQVVFHEGHLKLIPVA